MGGAAGDPERGQDESCKLQPSGHMGNCISGEAGGARFHASGRRGSVSELGGCRGPSPRPSPAVSDRAKDPGRKALGSLLGRVRTALGSGRPGLRAPDSAAPIPECGPRLLSWAPFVSGNEFSLSSSLQSKVQVRKITYFFPGIKSPRLQGKFYNPMMSTMREKIILFRFLNRLALNS